MLEQTVVRIDGKLDGITEALQSLTRIEERQIGTQERLRQGNEQFKDLEKRVRALELSMPTHADDRLAKIEAYMPGLIELRKWVMLGSISTLGLIGVAIIRMVVH